MVECFILDYSFLFDDDVDDVDDDDDCLFAVAVLEVVGIENVV